MGLLDSITGQVMNSLSSSSAGAPQSGMLEAITGLITNPQTGGLQGLVTAFEQNGLGGVVASWVGTGQNLPISAEQLQSVLGNEQIQAIAQKLGLSTQDIAGHLATLLPQAVDQMTPSGSVASGDALMNQAMGALGGLFKSS